MSLACPRISIGLPVYNGEKYLGEVLDSFLKQDFTDFELIISDNASTDRTGEICRRYAEQDARIRYYRNDCNLGASRNHNRVFHLARAPYFKWAGHDDLYAASFLRKCVELLDEAPPSVVVAYTGTLLIDERGDIRGELDEGPDVRGDTPNERLRQLLSNRKTWCHSVLGLMRADVLRTTRLLGAFGAADNVLLAELALRGEFHKIPEPLLLRRTGGGQSPSLHANPTPEELAAWFGYGSGPRIVFPYAKVLIEHVRAVRTSGLRLRQRWACYRVLRTADYAENWSRRALWNEMMRSVRRGVWERYSLAAIKRTRRCYLPHRLWAMFWGLKRADLQHIRLAMSLPSGRTHAALLQFVAQNLSRRTNRQSRELLNEWLAGPCEARRTAAALALHPGTPANERSNPAEQGEARGRSSQVPMKVSVIIPVYNSAAFVAEAVESALAQPETGQVILIDDGSSDNSLAVCRMLADRDQRVELLRHPKGQNRGVSASRNLGIAAARCAYLAFLDADDYYLPGRFRAASEIMTADPTIDGVYDPIGMAYEDERVGRWYRDQGNPDPITLTRVVDPSDLFEVLWACDRGAFHTDGIVVRTNLFERTGLFDTRLRMCEDTAMWLKMSGVGRLVAGSIATPVGMRRLHGNNMVFRDRDRNPYYAVEMIASLIRWGRRGNLTRQRVELLVDFLLNSRLCKINSDAPYLWRKVSELSLLSRFALRHPPALHSKHYWNVAAATIGWKRLKAPRSANRVAGTHNALSRFDVDARLSEQEMK